MPSIVLRERGLGRFLWCVTAAVALLGLVAELVHYLRPSLQTVLIPLFSLSIEGNFPTWYASSLLLCCGLLLLCIASGVAQTAARFPWRWRGLGAMFVFMSLDEAIELHENLGRLFDLHGVLFFSWVVPAGVLVLLMGLWYLPFVWHLPAPTRLRFVLAGVLYVGGALILELPLGHWAERHGPDNLTYALIDWVEETLELVGATLFLLSLLRFLREQHGSLSLTIADPA
jgi:hypothetical protein